MSTPTPSPTDLPPYETSAVLAAPYPERMRLLARTWAAQTNPTPAAVLIGYWVKYALLLVGGWAFFCSFSAGYTGLLGVADWGMTADAFRKAVLWILVYEISGFGCGSGPMNGRFWPPFGGFLHFLRPGTTKLPLFPQAPVIGGHQRTVLDVAVYAALLFGGIRALIAPEVTPALLLPVVVLVPILGVLDKTLFLAARAEHFWVALVCITVAGADQAVWLAGCKWIWIAIWVWAATSKLNRHFPAVIMVMMNNGPLVPKWLKHRLFVDYPDDLRPSKLAAVTAHMGTVAEYSIPVILLATNDPWVIGAGLVLMTGFHSYIGLNNPNGMPVEWNILMIYGAFYLFGFESQVSVLAVGAAPLLSAFLFFMLFGLPTFGNIFPERLSFLLSMRYYAGNWAYNVWLFRGESWKKLSRLKKATATMREQLERVLDDPQEIEAAIAFSAVTRLLHLQGKVLYDALPVAVGQEIDDYEWMDGEVFGGMVLGWNFGDGHLNGPELLGAVQEQCSFEPGELRVIAIESQPFFKPTMSWQVLDAADGMIGSGQTRMAEKLDCQPWPEGPTAAALTRRAAAEPSG